MSVYKTSKSRFYQFDFQLNGCRFFGSTEATERRDAEAVERSEKEKARLTNAAAKAERAQISGSAPLLLDVAAGRWWQEVGQHRADHKDCWRALDRMLAWFGRDKRLDAITDADIAQWVSERRGEKVAPKRKRSKKGDGQHPLRFIAPATVNRTTVDALRRIYGRARKSWKMAFANEPDWAQHRLPEPDERVRELGEKEQSALTAAARVDYERVYRFARLSGLRRKNCLIPKSAVKWDVGFIEIRGKGGKLNRVPLSQPLRELLTECWDDHDEMVFTYVAIRTRKTEKLIRGHRYPITDAGLKTQWRRDRQRASTAAPSILDYRFHDNRHTAATRLLRTSRNLKTAQRLLNHARISTTAKYAHVLDDEVLAAMDATPDAARPNTGPQISLEPQIMPPEKAKNAS